MQPRQPTPLRVSHCRETSFQVHQRVFLPMVALVRPLCRTNAGITCLPWQEFGADIIREDLSEYIAIALLLVAERAKGARSFWKSYIDVLPSIEEVRVVDSEQQLPAVHDCHVRQCFLLRVDASTWPNTRRNRHILRGRVLNRRIQECLDFFSRVIGLRYSRLNSGIPCLERILTAV